MLIRVSRGAEQHERTFLARKRGRERVASARRPSVNVAVARERPMMVRY